MIWKRLVDLYPERGPSESELKFFQSRPDVAGYAAPDGTVVINPFGVASTDKRARESVLKNERVRHFLWETKPNLRFDLTEEQKNKLGKDYAANEEAQRHTVLARLLAGDPSLEPYTDEQKKAAEEMSTSKSAPPSTQ